MDKVTFDTSSRTRILRDKAAEFCELFVSGAPPPELLSRCFTSNPKITEHGPIWATKRLPFLARPWIGRRAPIHSTSAISPTGAKDQSCDQYFDILGATLSFHPKNDSIPPVETFIVSPGEDFASGAVVVKAKSGLASVATGIGWEENFIFMFSEFDEEGRIGYLEIWSDALSAWMAVGGQIVPSGLD